LQNKYFKWYNKNCGNIVLLLLFHNYCNYRKAEAARAAVNKANQAQMSDPTIDHNAVSAFHHELLETCIDMMARYTFSSNVNMPKR